MDKQLIKQVFDDSLKFKVGQEVRHKGDSKEHSTDMGLLVLCRIMSEEESSDGERIFERHYHCRMIRFSGSGEIQRFAERELQTKEEHMQQQLDDELEREMFRYNMKITQEEVYKAYGVTKKSRVYLMDSHGCPDESTEYRVCGFKRGPDGSTLSLTSVAAMGSPKHDVDVKTSDEFHLIPEE